jgi:predicted ester cyclase
VTRWSFQGTHRGEFFGVPPTGRTVTTSGIDIWRVRDGRIVENQQVVDNLGLLQQLGAVPQPEPAQSH